MTNLLPTIAPKSDQLNADDLIGRSLTITVTEVSTGGDADQPVSIHYEGDDGKPYKPCKSMRRVMVHVWGPDGAKFSGRRMTLYRDDKVRFGPDTVGGIRISHMSHIDRDVTMALTATRASRRPFTVQPLRDSGKAAAVDLPAVLIKGREAADKGSAALTVWWSSLNREEKALAKPTLDSELKAAAVAADNQDSDAASGDGAVSDAPPEVEREAPSGGADPFPGDVTPSSSGEGAAESPEADHADEEKDSAAFDHIAWADRFIGDLPFLTKEQLDELENNKLELARFTQLQVVAIDKAQEFEQALKAAREAFA